MDGATELIHATAVAVGGRAVLIRGSSGSGKSDLALRCLSLGPSSLIDTQARLLADDQVSVQRTGVQLIARPPPLIAGKIEVRGVGIITLAHDSQAVVALVAELVALRAMERMPDPWPMTEILGLRVPVLRLWPFAASAPTVLLSALTKVTLPDVCVAR